MHVHSSREPLESARCNALGDTFRKSAVSHRKVDQRYAVVLETSYYMIFNQKSHYKIMLHGSRFPPAPVRETVLRSPGGDAHRIIKTLNMKLEERSNRTCDWKIQVSMELGSE